MKDTIAVMVLAAGKGKRMNAADVNKVVLPLGSKPMIVHTVDLLTGLGFKTIIVVVGFAKDSVMEALRGKEVIFSEQQDQLGTAHAVMSGLTVVPENITDVLVIQGDDSALYKKELLEKLITKHTESGSSVTFLTLQLENPLGLGRVIRNPGGQLLGIVEEKDATVEQKEIKEVNPACYMFAISFLKKYLSLVEKSSVTGEYYLTSLIDTALQNGEKIETIQVGTTNWRGVNTPDELKAAQELFSSLK